MSRIILLNKPFQVLSQFSDTKAETPRETLRNYITTQGFYPAGRLDYDSEGLLVLCEDGQLQSRISNPKFKLQKSYWAQLEGEISDEAIAALQKGVNLKDGMTKPAVARRINEPNVWSRNPPIRQRKSQTTSWLELTIGEGRNRQVRRMTAHVGFPTLRLIRFQIGTWTLAGLGPGEHRFETVHLPKTAERTKALSKKHKPKRQHTR